MKIPTNRPLFPKQTQAQYKPVTVAHLRILINHQTEVKFSILEGKEDYFIRISTMSSNYLMASVRNPYTFRRFRSIEGALGIIQKFDPTSVTIYFRNKEDNLEQ